MRYVTHKNIQMQKCQFSAYWILFFVCPSQLRKPNGWWIRCC
jgi:hypothetical protein